LREVQFEKRSFFLDALTCFRCTASMLVLALISEPEVVRKIRQFPLVTLATRASNPFRTSTTIDVAIPARARVSLRLHDVGGRLVHEWPEGVLSAGWYRREWDGRNRAGSPAPAGVYFLHLRAGATERSKKIVLLR
jgi:hypothetical protein